MKQRAEEEEEKEEDETKSGGRRGGEEEEMEEDEAKSERGRRSTIGEKLSRRWMMRGIGLERCQPTETRRDGICLSDAAPIHGIGSDPHHHQHHHHHGDDDDDDDDDEDADGISGIIDRRRMPVR